MRVFKAFGVALLILGIDGLFLDALPARELAPMGQFELNSGVTIASDPLAN